jgi:hypothetical protein
LTRSASVLVSLSHPWHHRLPCLGWATGWACGSVSDGTGPGRRADDRQCSALGSIARVAFVRVILGCPPGAFSAAGVPRSPFTADVRMTGGGT